MKISLIAATSSNNVIGKDNKLIWHISEDLKRFKKLTLNCPIIMGRKTYESLPFKPLPKRKNIIISSNKNLKFKGAIVVGSPKEAINICENDKEIFICGGETIYNEFIEIGDTIYLTKVHKEFEGDTFFPKISEKTWKITEKIDSSDENYKYSFLKYETHTVGFKIKP